MSLIAAKHFANLGWVGIKNRDRLYKPSIRLRKSFRAGMERLYLWDDLTKYTEGLNEFGVSIISSGIATEKDEREAAKVIPTAQGSRRLYYSPEGLRIRKALFLPTPEAALDRLIELQVPGATLVFNKDRCFIMEGSYVTNPDRFDYEVRDVSIGEVPIRTNHGLLQPWLGYGPDEPERKSSEARLRTGYEHLLYAKSPDEMLDAISVTSNADPQLNPLRLDIRKNMVRTTGQLLIIPSLLTLYYRPIWCQLKFRFENLNNQKEKTFFEVLSSRKLVTFKEHHINVL